MTTAAHQAPHRRIVLRTPPSLPPLEAPSVERGPRGVRRLRGRGRPALTGAAFGAVVGVLLTSGGMDPAAALTAGTGFGLAAGLLVPVPPAVPPLGPPIDGAPSHPAGPSGAPRP